MSYPYQLEDLLAELYPAAPTLVDAVTKGRRRVEHGLLSVGLKVHYLGRGKPFAQLVDALGGAQTILDVNYYRRERASLCLVLPPVGNVQCAVRLLEAIGQYVGIPLFNNNEVQIQICSPGRLSPESAGILAIVFYLGSDILQRYTLGDFKTTFSSFSSGGGCERGKRLVIYDASGDFDHNFAWWKRIDGQRHVDVQLPFFNGRTDILSGRTKTDIGNVNLAATLLCHVQYGGYWSWLGRRFEEEIKNLLARHLFDGLLSVPWVHAVGSVERGDAEFILTFKELMAYAFEEVSRVNWLSWHAREKPEGSKGILSEMKELLQKYRIELIRQSQSLSRGEPA